MKKFITILVLILSLQSWTKADDIRDFEIEGISIGDSLLEYFSEKEIKKKIIDGYSSDKYLTIQFKKKHRNFKTYDAMHINILKNDKKMKIYALHGMKEYIDNIKGCKKEKTKIFEEINSLFKNARFEHIEKKHAQDESGKSFTDTNYIYLQSGDHVSIACYDWSKEIGFKDHLRIAIVTKNFMDWINTEAYN